MHETHRLDRTDLNWVHDPRLDLHARQIGIAETNAVVLFEVVLVSETWSAQRKDEERRGPLTWTVT